MSGVNKNPKGLHTVTPGLTVNDAKGAIEFYKKAFGAVEIKVSLGPDEKVMHAEIKIGDSVVMLNDEFPEMGCLGPKSLGGSSIAMYLQVDDADMWFERAVKAGATVTMPLADQFWGDRFGQLADPYGHKWGVSTHVKDVTPEEMKAAMQDWEKKEMANCK
ncbi:MAG: VOC family protein [Candidatus Obscuribacterales bacterium]|nr:VOC family protein [Candidatus Obscuribacterales bacterium]